MTLISNAPPSQPYNIRPVVVLQEFINCNTAKNWTNIQESDPSLQSDTISVITSLGGCGSINGVDYSLDTIDVVLGISISYTWSRPSDSAKVSIMYTTATDSWRVHVTKGSVDSVSYADSANVEVNTVKGKLKTVWGGSLSIPSTGLVPGCDTGTATIIFG